MTETALISVGLFVAEQLLKQSPQMFVQFQQMLADKDITVEQLQARRAAIANQKFEDIVPNSQLPPDSGL